MTYHCVAISYYDVKDNSKNYNINNLHEYDAYIYNEETKILIIDLAWWKTLTPLITTELNKIKHFKLANVTVPHKIIEHPLVTQIYQLYIDAHDAQHWAGIKTRGPSEFETFDLASIHNNISETTFVIPITFDEKCILGKLTRMHLAEAKSIDDFSELNHLKERIEWTISNNNKINKWFIKLSGTSGKNEKAVQPVSSIIEIFKQLTSNMLFLHQEYDKLSKDTSLIITEWNDNIEKRNEFRVFVYNNKITGVSQQHWYDLFSYTTEEMSSIQIAISQLNKNLSSKIPIYNNCVIDIWIDIKKSSAHIIEYNPFGAYSGAGSSLFHWIKDNDKLTGDGKIIEIRFTSTILGEFEF